MVKVYLLAHTPEPERVVASAAKLCYSRTGVATLLEGLTPEKSAEFLEMLSDLGHSSPVEHASFTFGIEGVSRSFLAQITRHRIASFSVQSQRYVEYDAPSYVVPPEIAACPEALAVYEQALQSCTDAYRRITELLNRKYAGAEGGEADKARQRALRKKSIEDARFILPNACETKMVVTMNARELMHFFTLRCCSRAQWEIRAVANEMLRQASAAAPALFCSAGPACVRGACSEGKMSCGRAAEMREFYKELKEH